jgi:2-polyprenyl-6-hydroxyphenyl methylase/3-demethylubiquinone-9 3-methyltransferase
MPISGDRQHDRVNNDLYEQLGDRWYSAEDDPVALLRAESRARNPWVIEEIRRAFPSKVPKILDLGCGAGFLTNEAVRAGFSAVGLDASQGSLQVARRYDATGLACYEEGEGEHLPHPDGVFDAVCAMDFLEHVESPERVVSEAARVLVPGGLFFFHTFNRNLLSWLIVIKGVEWFVRNTPPHMHRLRYFIKPKELRAICGRRGLDAVLVRGLAPDILNRSFLRMLATGRVDGGFRFRFSRLPLTGYSGFARKR